MRFKITVVILLTGFVHSLAGEKVTIDTNVLPSDLNQLSVRRSGGTQKRGQISYGSELKIKAHFGDNEKVWKSTPEEWGTEYLYVKGQVTLQPPASQTKTVDGLLAFKENMYIPPESTEDPQATLPRTKLISVEDNEDETNDSDDEKVEIVYSKLSELAEEMERLSYTDTELAGWGPVNVRLNARQNSNVIQLPGKVKVLKAKDGNIYAEQIYSNLFYETSREELFSDGKVLKDVYFLRKAGTDEQILTRETRNGPSPQPYPTSFGVTLPVPILEADLLDSLNFDGECTEYWSANVVEYRHDVVVRTTCLTPTSFIGEGRFIINGDAGVVVKDLIFNGLYLEYHIDDTVYPLEYTDIVTIRSGNTFKEVLECLDKTMEVRTRIRYIDIEELWLDLKSVASSLEEDCLTNMIKRRFKIQMYEYYKSSINVDYVCDYSKAYINQQLTILDQDEDGNVRDVRRCDGGMWYTRRQPNPDWNCDNQVINPFGIRLLSHDALGLKAQQSLDQEHLKEQSITLETVHRVLRDMRQAVVKSRPSKWEVLHFKPYDLGYVSIEGRHIVSLHTKSLKRDKETKDLKGVYAAANYQYSSGIWPNPRVLYFDGWNFFQREHRRTKLFQIITDKRIHLVTDAEPKEEIHICPSKECALKTHVGFMYFRNLWRILKRLRGSCRDIRGNVNRRLIIQFKNKFYIEGRVDCSSGQNIFFPMQHTVYSFSDFPEKPFLRKKIVKDEIVFGLVYSMRSNTFHSSIGAMDTTYAIQMKNLEAGHSFGKFTPVHNMPDFYTTIIG